MDQFMGPPMGYYNPPDVHEVCECEECHVAGDHDNDTKYWAETRDCLACIEDVLTLENIDLS